MDIPNWDVPGEKHYRYITIKALFWYIGDGCLNQAKQCKGNVIKDLAHTDFITMSPPSVWSVLEQFSTMHI